MAGDEVVQDFPGEIFKESSCNHCNKKVVNSSKCVKCGQFFHPKCLLQAAAAKSAVCKHEATNEVKIAKTLAATNNGDTVEKSLLLRIIRELEEKNTILLENNQLLKEKVRFLEFSRQNARSGNSGHNRRKREIGQLTLTDPSFAMEDEGRNDKISTSERDSGVVEGQSSDGERQLTTDETFDGAAFRNRTSHQQKTVAEEKEMEIPIVNTGARNLSDAKKKK